MPHIISFETGNSLKSLLLDVILDMVNEHCEPIGDRPQQGIHVGEVSGPLRTHHGPSLRVHSCQVVSHHSVLNFFHDSLVRTGERYKRLEHVSKRKKWKGRVYSTITGCKFEKDSMEQVQIGGLGGV